VFDRPTVLSGTTVVKETPCGKCYTTINYDGDSTNGKDPKEVIIDLGKAGGCPAAFLSTIGRLISISLQYGVPAEKITKQLLGVRCHAADMVHPSCIHAVGAAMVEVNGGGHNNSTTTPAAITTSTQVPPKVLGAGACPECGSPLAMQEGCATCINPACGWSRCG